MFTIPRPQTRRAGALISLGAASFLLVFHFGAATSRAQFQQLWMIGIENNNQNEFDPEFQENDDYYVDNGDYTALGGQIWTTGREPTIDPSGSLGFERALTNTDPHTRLLFQLENAEADAAAQFRFSADMILPRGGLPAENPANSTHNLEFEFNGAIIGTAADISTGLLEFTFSATDVFAVEGSNEIVIRRTGGSYDALGEPSWIQFDWVKLEADLSATTCPAPICNFNGPALIDPGQSATLTWLVAPGQTVSIDNGVGDVTGQTNASGVGQVDVFPSETLTYTLMSTGPGGSGTAEVTVEVRNIFSFAASQNVVRPGQVSTLNWAVDPAASVSIEPGIGNVDALTVNGVGSIDVSPEEPTTYVLTSTRGDDVATAEAFVLGTDFEILWQIGDDDNGITELSHEGNTDEDYYFEDGDYSAVGGMIWSAGMEPWCDDTNCLANGGDGNPSIGFPRAVINATTHDEIKIYFTLDAEQFGPSTEFRFSWETFQSSGSLPHAFDLGANQVVHASFPSVSPGELVTLAGTAAELGLQPGANMIFLTRTGGESPWITFDYVFAEIDASMPLPFVITDVSIDDFTGDVTVEWRSQEGATYRVFRSSTVSGVWAELVDSYPPGGATGPSTIFVDPQAANDFEMLFYYIAEE